MADGTPRPAQIRIAQPLLMDWAYLAANMRDDERQQWASVMGEAYDQEAAARGFALMPGLSWVLVDREHRPVCGGGFEEIRPRVWQTWMAGTAGGWEQHWRAITKYSRTVMGNLFDTGRAQRVQTYALATRRAAHAWYERGLQQRFECEMPRFFADGSAAVCYARTIDMHREARDGKQ